MDRRTFLGLGGGVLGVVVGGSRVYDALADARSSVDGDEVTPSAPRPVDASTPTPTNVEETPTTTPSPETFEARDGDLLLGLTPQTADRSALSALERWQGRRNAVLTVYADLGQSREELLTFGEDVLTPIWNHGSVPHLVWQPYLGSPAETPPTIPQDIAAGDHDRLLEHWADVLGRWVHPEDGPDRRLYLNFAPEMNGDWVPWDTAGGDTTPADYVGMYRRVHDVVTATGLTSDHVQWVWAVNHVGRASAPLEAFYPGDDYVDWCGVHGYNWSKWGGWKPPAQIYDAALDAIASFSERPLVVSEYGCSSALDEGHDPAKKGRWIRDAFAYFEERGVGMALWFNHEKETDWAVFGGSAGTETVTVDGTHYEAYREYREAVEADWVLPAYPDHPRRLTDAEFRGAFGVGTDDEE